MNFQKISCLFSSKYKINLNIIRQCCERNVIKCVPAPKKPMTIAVIGVNSCVGMISAMLLKESKIFTKMYLYDRKTTSTLADDLNTANKSPMAESFCGIKQLGHAVKKARIVFICGGLQVFPGFSEQDLFNKNGPWVRQVITYCAEFNPGTHIVISSPPVSFLVPMAIEEFRKSDIDAGKRVYGLVRHLVSRSNTFTGAMVNMTPDSVHSFVVGGGHRRTFIPIYSHVPAAAALDECKSEALTDRIQDAEDCALRQNMRENRCDGCCYSIAYNGVKFVTRLAKALEGEPNIMDCAFVKQNEPMTEYAKYLSCVINMDTTGIKSCHIPKMSDAEKTRLKKVINEIRHNVYLGSSYVTGDDLIIVRTPVEKKKVVEPVIEKKIEKPKEKRNLKIGPPKQISVKVCKNIPDCIPVETIPPCKTEKKKKQKKKNK